MDKRKIWIAVVLVLIAFGVVWGLKSTKEGPPRSLNGSLYYNKQEVDNFEDKCSSLADTPQEQVQTILQNAKQYPYTKDGLEHVKILGPKVGKNDGSHICDLTLQQGKVTKTDFYVEIR